MARKTISQRIALEGGEAIKKALAELGKAGEAAFKKISDAAEKVKTPGANFSKSLQEVRKNVDNVGVAGRALVSDTGRLIRSFGDLGTASLRVVKNVGLIAATLGTATSALALMVSGAGDAAKEINNLAQVANSTPQEFQKWSYGAQTVGIEQEKLSGILQDTTDRVGDFITTGGGPMADFFEKIAPKVGLTAQHFAKLSGPEALQLFVSSLEKANLGQQEMTFYMEAIASDATLLLPLLRDNGAAMNALGEEAERLGLVIGDKALSRLIETRQELSVLGAAARSVQTEIAAVFAPFVGTLARSATAWIGANKNLMIEFARVIEASVVTAMSDFLYLISGDDDRVQMRWMIEARDLVVSFANTVRNSFETIILPAFDLIVEGSERIASTVNKLFGTEFTGQEILVAAFAAKIVGVFGVIAAAATTVGAAISTVLSLVGLLAPIGGLLASVFGAISTGVSVVVGALAALVGWPALIIAALVAAGVAIYAFWDEIVSFAKVAWAGISQIFVSGGEVVGAAFKSIGKAIEAVFDGIASIGRRVLEGIVGLAKSASERVATAWKALPRVVGEVWDAFLSGASIIMDQVSNALIDGFQFAVNRVRSIMSGLLDWLRDSFGDVGDFIIGVFDGVIKTIKSLWETVKSVASAAKGSANEATTSSGSSYTSTPAFRSGGLATGPGTGTSDSILARISNGEFIVRAAAVREYGVGFLNALNKMRLPKFATGGLVQMPAPRFDLSGIAHNMVSGLSVDVPKFATGGLVSAPSAPSGRPLSLSIGGEVVHGLTANDSAIDQLQRMSAKKQVARTGRKPGWVGG